MASEITLTVLTAERSLLRVEDAMKVRLRLIDEAWLSIYPGHAPLIAEILPGPVQYETAIEAGELELAGGILQVADNRVTVLTRGLRRDVRDGKRVGHPASAEDARFDRLARELMLALEAQPAVGQEAASAAEEEG
ncbi:MAG: hypothetical protein ACP5HG_07600 [Anaerolineae bacterium]